MCMNHQGGGPVKNADSDSVDLGDTEDSKF